MDWEVLGNLGSFLQGIAGILTLITIFYVLKQTREMAKQNRFVAASTVANLYEEVASTVFNIDMIFFKNPQLRPFFYSNIEIGEEDQDYGRAYSAAEILMDFMDLFVVLERVTPHQAEISLPWSDWNEYFMETYGNSPIIRKYWSEHKNWYSNTLAELLEPLPNEYLEEDGSA